MINWIIKDELYGKLNHERSFHLFKYRGLWCFIQRSMAFGNLCGYVAIECNHPFYCKAGDDCVVVPEASEIPYNGSVFGLLGSLVRGLPNNMIQIELFLQVHCGITWARDYVPGIESDLLGKLWWFGFDTSHAGDARLIDFTIEGRPSPYISRETYKDYNYVLTHVYRLADQLADMLPKSQVLIDVEPFIKQLEKLKKTFAL